MKKVILLAFLIFISVSFPQSPLNVKGTYNIHGQITGTNGQGLQGIEVKTKLYDETWPAVADSSINTTDSQGNFNMTFTGIEEIIQIENIGEIKYQIINTPQIQLNLNKLSKVKIKLYDILGQEITTLLDEETTTKTVNADINNLASGTYILQTTIDEKPYNNTILKTGEKYNYGKTKQEITKETTTKKNNLEKITNTYSYYGFNITDPTGQYYTQQEQVWNLWPITSTDIEHNNSL